MKYILWAFIIYILYRFVVGFIVPVYKTTQKIKKGFRDMHNQANETINQQQADQSNTNNFKEAEKKKAPIGDYIDFEELK